MKKKANVNLQIGFGLSILLLILSSAISYVSIRKLLESSALVKHTNDVALHLERTLAALRDAEATQRGFLLTEKNRYLDPFKGFCDEALEGIRTLESLTLDNPSQQQLIPELYAVVRKRIHRMELMIDVKRQSGQLSEGDMEEGRLLTEQVRSMARTMQQEENRLLAERTADEERFITYTPVFMLIATLLAILISVVFYIRIVNDMTRRAELQEELEEKDRETARRLEVVQSIAMQISDGDYKLRINDAERDTLGSLAGSLNRMAASLSVSFEKLADNEWLQSGLAALNERMMGEKQLKVLTRQIITFLAEYTESNAGALYLLEGGVLKMRGSYALEAGYRKEVAPGEGIIGQCMTDGKPVRLRHVQPENITISYVAGKVKPAEIVAFPIMHEGHPLGAFELASVHPYTDKDLEFISISGENIGTAVSGAINHKRLQELLEETQAQAEELQAQHSELENLNTELETHTQKLQASEEELKVQQEELQQANAELEERNHMITERNAEIVKKAEELEQSTRYKSEFMANMSHELRTPLNSILLLSRYLSEDGEKNLTEDQRESAGVIFSSGTGLLNLIDELLDLSKIEAGKMDVEYVRTDLAEVLNSMHSLFLPVAQEKQIDLLIANELQSVSVIETDKMKLEQILKNLLSNALKFTSAGYVKLRVKELPNNPQWVEFAVEDTGVGIPKEKLDLVFEAFTQADGSTKRKYGGTGLGLSISRQLARLLGGEIRVSSEPAKGSAFRLVVPGVRMAVGKPDDADVLQEEQPGGDKEADTPPETKSGRYVVSVIPPAIPDDRDKLKPGDQVILIVEDDTAFAKALLQFARKQNYKGIVVVRGDQALEVALQYKPRAILLDIQLPVKDGWEVMEELKSNKETRPIPVHIMSSLEAKKESRRQGAVDFINKPLAVEHMKEMFGKLEAALTKNPKKVLIVEENTMHARALAYFLETFELTSAVKHTVAESIESLHENEVDCVILDMGIPGKSGYETLESVKRNPGLEDVPIIIFTGKNLSHAEESRIRQYADSIVVKTAHSYQRILDEVALFLHLVEKTTDQDRPEKKDMGTLRDILSGKTVLIADDDVRNIFSLTKALEKYRVRVLTATDGAEALQQLEEHGKVDIVLMDMMMPQMDGYESTRRIRNDPRFKQIPVIAVTAKAMLGDREKCIAAGASDYISKPVDTDQLISLLRVWLYDKQR